MHEVLTAPKTKDEQLKKARDEENRMNAAVEQKKEITKIMNQGISEEDINRMFLKAQQVYDEIIKSFNSVPLSHVHYAHNAYEKAIKAGLSVERAFSMGTDVGNDAGMDEYSEDRNKRMEWTVIYAFKRIIEIHPNFNKSYEEFKSAIDKYAWSSDPYYKSNGWTDNKYIAQGYINDPDKYLIDHNDGTISIR